MSSDSMCIASTEIVPASAGAARAPRVSARPIAITTIARSADRKREPLTSHRLHVEARQRVTALVDGAGTIRLAVVGDGSRPVTVGAVAAFVSAGVGRGDLDVDGAGAL